MGVFDKVKKILFDEEELEDLPNHDKEQEEMEEVGSKGGIILHHQEEEDVIQEVKVPEEKPTSLRFPVDVDDYTGDYELSDIQSRLDEENLSRTQEIEKVREEQLTRSKEDIIKEYNETLRIQREEKEQKEKELLERRQRELMELKRRELEMEESKPVDTPTNVENMVRKEKEPYTVPPVISPVFGVLDKNYNPNEYEETRQKISLTNAGNTSKLSERQFGPVSYNDQGIPQPKYHKTTTVITTTSPKFKEDLKKDKELIKETEKIEEEIINNIINDDIEEPKKLEDTNEYDDIINDVDFEEPVDTKTVLENLDEDNDEVITGSPYDDILEEQEKNEEPSVDINDLINSVDEEADIQPDAPKDVEDNVNLDDTIETDLYGLIDSMYKDEE